MLSKSEILITKRFLFSKKTEGYISIFSWFSIIGIALGSSSNYYSYVCNEWLQSQFNRKINRRKLSS
jgi:ABC-type lipoprotein release transport system permease subunit